jgi:Na+-driven multidrug efflux pump
VTLVLLVAGEPIIALMTTNPDVRAEAATYLVYAAMTPLAGVLAFQMDGVFIGATWSREMRNMMLASLAVFVALLLLLVPAFGNHGLWLALIVFLGARGVTLLARLRPLTRRTFPT